MGRPGPEDAERARRGVAVLRPGDADRARRRRSPAASPRSRSTRRARRANCRMWVAAAGGGIWRTDDALALHRSGPPPPDDLPTTAFGSLYLRRRPRHALRRLGRAERLERLRGGLGLFKSTDGGASWSLVPGSAAVATNRSIGAIAPTRATRTRSTSARRSPATARRPSTAAAARRRTRRRSGVYKSTNGGAELRARAGPLAKAPPPTRRLPRPATTGSRAASRSSSSTRTTPTQVYAAVFGYGVWRSADSGGHAGRRSSTR